MACSFEDRGKIRLLGPAMALVWLCACSASPPAELSPRSLPPAKPAPAGETEAEGEASAAGEPVAEDAGGETPAPAAVEEISLLSWDKELDSQPIVSLAIGKRRVAALERGARAGSHRAVWMRELGKPSSWRELTLPEKLQPEAGERDALRVFFGRDDRPRLMGTRTTEDGEAQHLYYRWKGNWRDKPGETGRLEGPPPAAMFGLLGHADPEVVCKLGDTCIIKRLSGWTMVPVPEHPHLVEIAGGSAFAVAPGSALRIDEGDKAWRPLSDEVPWREPRGLWALSGDDIWVAEERALHHWDGERWQSMPSPLPGAWRLWGAAPDEMWLAAEGGMAHYDGKRWRKLVAPKDALFDVAGKKDELFAGGASGLWVGRSADE